MARAVGTGGTESLVPVRSSFSSLVEMLVGTPGGRFFPPTRSALGGQIEDTWKSSAGKVARRPWSVGTPETTGISLPSLRPAEEYRKVERTAAACATTPRSSAPEGEPRARMIAAAQPFSFQ